MKPEDEILEADRQQKQASKEELRELYNRLAARLQDDLDAAPDSMKETQEYLPEAQMVVSKVEQTKFIEDQSIATRCNEINSAPAAISAVWEGLSMWQAVRPEHLLLKSRSEIDINAENRLFYKIRPKLIVCRGRRKSLERCVRHISARIEDLKNSPYYNPPQGSPSVEITPPEPQPVEQGISWGTFDARKV
jgi:hypothetical protein